MTLAPGDVVWHRAPFKDDAGGRPPPRPWLLVSNSNHPFHGSEYVGLGMTTRERERAILIEEDDWEDGGLEKSGFVSPWFVMTIKHADVSHRVGAIDAAIVDEALTALFDCLGPDTSL